MRRLDLRPSPELLAPAVVRPPGRRVRPPRGETPAEQARAVKRRVDRWLDRDIAAENARSGRAHPYLVTLQRRADLHFNPTAAVVPSRLRDGRAELWRAYLAAAQKYNSMGMPLPGDRNYLDAPSGERLLPALVGREMIEQHVRAHGGQTAAAVICLRVRPGAPPALERKTESSGIGGVDRLARRALTSAVRGTRAPADVEPGRACYRFAVTYGRLPVVNAGASCRFAGLFRGKGCSVGGDRFFHKRVALARLHLERRN